MVALRVLAGYFGLRLPSIAIHFGGLPLGAYSFHLFSGAATPVSDGSVMQAILSGLLVGIGVKLGSGCTSGHGVCGIGRLSVRSLVATVIFMLSGIVTVTIVRHLL